MLLAAGVPTIPLDETTVETVDGTRIRVLARRFSPTPSAVQRDLSRVDSADRVFYVLDDAKPSLRRQAATNRQVWFADIRGKTVTVNGHELNVDFNAPRTTPPQKPGPPPYGRFAVARALLRTEKPQTQVQLAAATGITQAAVSGALRLLGEHVTNTANGWSTTDADALFDYAVNKYPGPGGIRTDWYSTLPLTAQADSLRSIARRSLISGDIAASEYAAWRVSKTTVVYSDTGIDAARHAFAESSPTEKTATVVVPADKTVWVTAQHWFGGSPATTDPIISAWEVLQSGGAGDEVEAVEQIKARVLAERRSHCGYES